ncbi:MAG: hypothetical protein CBB97_07305 [Candidatus Endolissoclinum sp. TMED37]|nr:MAG: hypothetical protein CBB97_07305 [Candidatus Endolissoclinum sp. TMED37]|tara:strand:+ start:228 stop:617 length:390 start_codon:yes stop_codon:yes gene_type:complete
MDLNNKMERAFFKDMLSNGIPVTENFDFDLIAENLQDAASNIGDFDTSLVDGMKKIIVLDKFGIKVISIKYENEKLIFYSTSAEDAFENARLIGQLVFLVVSICSIYGFLNLGGSIKAEESFDFDSDFV